MRPFLPLRVPNVGVLREEEPRQQAVDAEQPVTGQGEAVSGRVTEKAVCLQCLKRPRKAGRDIDPVFLLKVRRLDDPELEL